MTKQARIAVLTLLCAVLGGWGIAMAGAASAAGVATPAPQSAQVAGSQARVSVATTTSVWSAPRVRVAAAKLHCKSHKSESKPVKGKVVVPKNYCYDPHKSGDKSLNDYCTSSPDAVFIPSAAPFGIGSGTVDFRGPCARHDMCLAHHSHGTCDRPLLSDMKKNCVQRFSRINPARYECYSVAGTYFLAIKAKTKL